MSIQSDTVLTNARIVLRNEVVCGTVQVKDGCIEAVDPGRSNLPAAIDCEGDYLLPGFVELHTDNLEKHFGPRPGVAWPAVPAAMGHDAQLAAAGITTVFDAVCLGDLFRDSGRVVHLRRMVAAISEAQEAGLLRADHRIHLRCELSFDGVVELFDEHAGSPLVGLISLMDHTPGQRQFVHPEAYRNYYQKKYGLTDEELAEFTASQMRAHEEHSAPNRVRIVERARDRGLAIASHDDATPDHVREAAALGAVISEFPTTVEAAEEARRHELKVLMGAPNLVLGGSHSGNVSAAELARRGLLDVISSDYVPGSMLHAVFGLADGDDAIRLPDAVAKVSANPAAAAGMGDRGAIACGRRADLLRVRLYGGVPAVAAVWRQGERVL